MLGDLLSRLRCGRVPSLLVASLLLVSPMGLTHGASEFTLDEAEHAYRVGLLGVAKEAYVGLLGGEHDKQVLLRLLEIALRRGAWDRADELLRSSDLQSDEGLLYWEAQVALGLNKTREAVFALTQFLERSPEHPLALPASLSLAAFQLDAGQYEAANVLLDPWSPSDDIRVDYLKARCSMEKARHSLKTRDIDKAIADAINRFERLRQSPGELAKDWLAKVYLGLAMERLAKRPVQRESAAEILREYLEEFASDRDAVELLAQAEAFATPAQRNAWQTWATERSPDLRALIAIAVSKTYAKLGEFIPAIKALEVIQAGHSGYEESLMLHARWQLEGGHASACLIFIEEAAEPALAESEWLPELLTVKGIAQFQVGDSEAALSLFTRVDETSQDTELSKVAAFNSVVLNPAEDNREAHESAMRGLYEVAEPAVQNFLGGEAAFLRALLLAKVTENRRAADAALRDYLAAYPIHPRRSEALIARLELALVALSPNQATVERRLKRLRKEVAEDYARERVDYLALWAASANGQHSVAHELIGGFRKAFPGSSLLPNVTFREVELLLAEGNLNASAREEMLEMSLSGDPRVKAQAGFILATLWGRLGDHDAAIKEWGRVIDLKGRHQILARHGFALALRRVNDQVNAIIGWDGILQLKPSRELQIRVLLSKGECKALLATVDNEAGAEAQQLFEEVLALPNLAVEWQDQASYRLGMVQLALGLPAEALGTFRQVVRGYEERFNGASLGDQPVCNDWVYRAGFEAITIVESQGKDRDAASRADNLARFPGERSAEAKERAGDILLEHWRFFEAKRPVD